MAEIQPIDGDQTATAALLLALVDQHSDAFHPRDVSITHGSQGLVFVVPDGLAKLLDEELGTGGQEEYTGDDGDQAAGEGTEETGADDEPQETTDDEPVEETVVKEVPTGRIRKINPKATQES